LSNFLLWQTAYSEWVVSPVFWPDFDKEDLRKAIIEYGNRDRRFGKVSNENHESK
jgi:undecaprenyl diphosphate synthase